MEISSGSRLGHYEVSGRLGKGGMGEVYRARDTKLNRDVALKVLPADFAQDAERRMRFEREAQAVAALNHPNIVTIHSVEQSDETHFITMELVEGKTLTQHIPNDGIPLDRMFELAVPLADALAAAHNKGITHRDLKPDNVMVTDDGRVKVLDFGLAKLADSAIGSSERSGASEAETATATAAGKVLGTVAYMSPEQAEGKPVDARSDVFALGVLLYEMATGGRPFEGDTPISTITAILRDTPPPLTDVRQSLPRHLSRIVSHCLAKEPDRRYQSALDVRNELDELRREVASGEVEMTSTLSGIGPVPPAPAPSSGRRIGPILGIVILVTLIGLGTVWLIGRDSSKPGSSSGPAEPTGPVAVVGFENLGDPDDADQFNRMLVGLITTGLGDFGGIELVSSAKVRTSLKEAGATGGGFDPTLAAKAARIAGAGAMVVGQVIQNDGQLLLTAELVDVKSGNALGTMRAEGMGKSALFAMAGEIATQVHGQFGPSQAEEGLAIDLAQSLTESHEAYGLYAAGQLAVNERRFDEAIGQLEEAIRIDPTFALAYYELGMAQLWHGDRAGALRNLHNGLQYTDRLPTRWQTTYRAVIDYEAGNVDSGFTALERLVAESPGMPDPYNYLGEFLFHYSKYADGPRAGEMFARALEIDPTYKIVLFHLTGYLLRHDKFDEARDLLDRYANDRDPSAIRLRLGLLYYESRFAEIVALEQDPALAQAVRSNQSFWSALIFTGNAGRALELSRQSVEQSVGYSKGNALTVDARLSLRVGRFRRALEDLKAAPQHFDSPVTFSLGAQMHLTHMLELELLGDSNGAIAQVRAAREIDYFHPRSRFYAMRLLFAAGEIAEAEREFAGLEALARDNRSPYHGCWLELARAERLRVQATPVEALDLLSPPQSPVCKPPTQISRELLIAQAAEDAGDLERALRHYRTVANPPRARSPIFDYWTDIPALYEVARIEQKLGQVDDSRRDYRKFLDHWGNADMPIPMVERARQELAVLGGN